MTATVSLTGQRLKTARMRKMLDQWELAAMARVTRETVCKIENGHVSPRRGTLKKLAWELGVEPSWLWAGDKP